MPIFVAAAIPFWTAAATAGGTIAAGAIGAHAASNAADKQTQAANYAADQQLKAQEDALAFQKQQAALDEARYEAAQHANYNQYVQKIKGAQALGQSIGFNLPDAAPYVPVTPGSAPSGGPAAPSAGGKAMPAIDPSKGDIGQQISAYFKSQGVPDTETPYWVQKWQEFGSKDPAYFNSRLAQADIFGGGAAASAQVAPAFQSSIASYVAPQAPVAPAAPVAAVQPFQLRSLSAYLRQPQGI